MTAEALPALACASASLRRAARAVTQVYDAALRETGLRVTQFTLLQALQRSGASAQARLGELLALDPTTLTRTLRPLARAGWIRVTPDATVARCAGRSPRRGGGESPERGPPGSGPRNGCAPDCAPSTGGS